MEDQAHGTEGRRRTIPLPPPLREAACTLEWEGSELKAALEGGSTEVWSELDGASFLLTCQTELYTPREHGAVREAVSGEAPPNHLVPDPPITIHLAKLPYVPHPRQEDVHNDWHRERIVSAGIQSGKTTAAAFEACRYFWDIADMHWVLAPSYRLLRRIETDIARLLRPWLVGGVLKYHRKDRIIETVWADRALVFLSADWPDQLRSDTVASVTGDEYARVKPEVPDIVDQRLKIRRGPVMGYTTPKQNNWFNRRYWLGWRQHRKRVRVFNFRSIDNPAFDRQEWDDAKARYSKEWFLEEFCGIPADMSGGVYKVPAHDDDDLRYSAPPVGEEIVAVGADIAKRRDWSTLWANTRDLKVAMFERFHVRDWEEWHDRLEAFGVACEEHNGAAIGVKRRPALGMDTANVGDVLHEQVVESARWPRVVAYNWHDSRLRERCIKDWMMAFDKRLQKLPLRDSEAWFTDFDIAEKEIEEFEQRETASGNIVFRAGGEHEDCMVAGCIAHAVWLIETVEPEIADAATSDEDVIREAEEDARREAERASKARQKGERPDAEEQEEREGPGLGRGGRRQRRRPGRGLTTYGSLSRR